MHIKLMRSGWTHLSVVKPLLRVGNSLLTCCYIVTECLYLIACLL